MHKLVAIAGTFDRLHKGHEYFIQQAFRLGHKVIIGLTSDQYVKEKLKALSSRPPSRDPSRGAWIPGQARNDMLINVEEFVKRKKELDKFLKEKGFQKRAQIVEIDDVYGPAVDHTFSGAGRNEIEALVVTSDTLEGGRKVNKKRWELGLKPLKLLQVPLIIAEDHHRIASTRIRLGEIDRSGRVLARLKLREKPISDKLRSNLKKPLGFLIKGIPDNYEAVLNNLRAHLRGIKPVMLITVGDEVTKLCNESGINSDLSIIDFRVGRIKKYFSLSDLGFRQDRVGPCKGPTLISIRNPAGNIKQALVAAVTRGLKSYIQFGGRRIIKVIGEEDLAGVPAILLAPLGSLVLYGQPGEGIVAVEVTEEKKNNLLRLLEKY